MLKTIKRLNRKYRQFINYIVTAIIIGTLIYIGGVKIDQHIDNLHNDFKSEQISYTNTIDSLTKEIERLKVGIDETNVRKFKIQSGANIIKDIRKDFSEVECMKLASLIYDESDRNSVLYSYAMALITVESRFNYKAKSNVGASGLMQIMPLTFEAIALKNGYPYDISDIYDLKKNTRIGMLYIYHLKKTYGKVELVSAGYNGGPRVAERYKMFMNGDTTVYIPDETKKYVESVNMYFYKYKRILGE